MEGPVTLQSEVNIVSWPIFSSTVICFTSLSTLDWVQAAASIVAVIRSSVLFICCVAVRVYSRD